MNQNRSHCRSIRCDELLKMQANCSTRPFKMKTSNEANLLLIERFEQQHETKPHESMNQKVYDLLYAYYKRNLQYTFASAASVHRCTSS